MAILVENEYQKIIEVKHIYANDSTEVMMRCYASKADRDKEKILKDDVFNVKFSIYQYLDTRANELIDEINAIQPIETITNKDEFLSNRIELKNKIAQFEDMRSEGVMLQDKLLSQVIDYNALKYKSVWAELGLTAEMCIKINIVGDKIVGLDNVDTFDLSTLYGEVKKKIVGPVVDC